MSDHYLETKIFRFFVFFEIFLEDISSVSQALISLFWTSDDVCHWFQSQRASFAYMLSHLNGFLRSDRFNHAGPVPIKKVFQE